MCAAPRPPRRRRPTPPELYYRGPPAHNSQVFELVPDDDHEAADPASTLSPLNSCPRCGAQMVSVAMCRRHCKASLDLQEPTRPIPTLPAPETPTSTPPPMSPMPTPRAAAADDNGAAAAAADDTTLLPPPSGDGVRLAAPTTPRSRPPCESDRRRWQCQLEPSKHFDVVKYTARDDADLSFREDQAGDWVLYQDLDGRIYWWNEVTTEWFWRPLVKHLELLQALMRYEEWTAEQRY